MTDRQKRFQDVYEYLRSLGKIHTKIDFATAIGVTKDTVYRAYNGNENYLNDNIFMRIYNAFENMFDKNWLLTGENEMCSKEKTETNISSHSSTMDKEILKKAFSYLRYNGKVHSQKGLSEIMHYNPASVSRAFAGDARYLTEDFLISLNKAFGNIFRQEWLMTGEGEMLISQQPKTISMNGEHLTNEEELRRQSENRLWEIIHDYQANNRNLIDENKRLRAENERLRALLDEKGKAVV